jgi:hypothetical protein
MLLHEKERLLELLHHEWRWCKHAEAQDQHGEAVRYDDATAVAWDLTGAMCLLFGWQRACTLFRELDRHIIGQRREHHFRQNLDIVAMAALQDFNDLDETTYDEIAARVNSMPVRRGNKRRADQS